MKIQLSQINVKIGDLQGNLEKVLAAVGLTPKGVDFIVFPELTLTGYPPRDLLLRDDFIQEQLDYAEQIVKESVNVPNLHIVIGLATRNTGKGKPLFNSLWVIKNGKVVMTYNKQLLPTYNVFDENRYFESGNNSQNARLLVGDNYVGFIICEDAWNGDGKLYGSHNPVADAARAQVHTLITINASPSHVGKVGERYTMYKDLARKHSMNIVYVNQVGAHDSLIFDGYSFVATPAGITAMCDGYEESSCAWDSEAQSETFDSPAPRGKVAETFRHLVLGIRDYVEKNGFKSIVVGCSGGIDSALVLALATAALGKKRVFAITMPSKFSSEGSVKDSWNLCRNLGIALYERPIGEEVAASIEAFKRAFGSEPKRLTIENEQARIRGRILMEYSNDFGALVLSTGNKTETSVGYCTLYGDTNGGLAVIADLYKMEVYELAKWMNINEGLIPKEILNKAPSAELWEGQRDTDSLPPYPILDALLKLYIEKDCMSKEAIDACRELIKPLSLQDIEKYLLMVDRAEFKRQQAPPVLRVHPRSFGAGRDLPITQGYMPSYKSIL